MSLGGWRCISWTRSYVLMITLGGCTRRWFRKLRVWDPWVLRCFQALQILKPESDGQFDRFVCFSVCLFACLWIEQRQKPWCKGLVRALIYCIGAEAKMQAAQARESFWRKLGQDYSRESFAKARHEVLKQSSFMFKKMASVVKKEIGRESGRESDYM